MLDHDQITPETTLGEVARAYPKSISFFLDQDLDICCGGGDSMGHSASRRQMSWKEFYASLLNHLEQQDLQAPLPTWRSGEEGALIDYIITEFHEKHRIIFQQIRQMLAKVCKAHSEKSPIPGQLSQRVTLLFDELEPHMHKEELILFPLIRYCCGEKLAQRPACGPPSPEAPMRVMRDEHITAGVILEEIRTLCNDFRPPSWACTTVKGLYDALGEFDRQLRLHIHLENNVLFPMVEQQLETAWAGRT